jgi:hypothetical protein
MQCIVAGLFSSHIDVLVWVSTTIRVDGSITLQMHKYITDILTGSNMTECDPSIFPL